jgi:esterase
MRLNCQTFGEGFPLLILHGFLGSSDNWRSVSKRLGNQFKVYTLDLRNHGASPHSEIMSYAVMCQDILEFMDDHKLPSVFLLGHSMGGKVAMQCAVDFPNRVEKLVIIDIAPRTYPPTHRPILNAALSLDLKTYKSFGEVDGALAATIPQAAVRQLLLKNLKRENDGHLTWKVQLDAIARHYDKLTTAIVTGQMFNHPTCFIRGGRSNYIREEDVPTIREIFPHAEIKTIPNAGHWVHADATEEFLNIVIEFLTQN